MRRVSRPPKWGASGNLEVQIPSGDIASATLVEAQHSDETEGRFEPIRPLNVRHAGEIVSRCGVLRLTVRGTFPTDRGEMARPVPRGQAAGRGVLCGRISLTAALAVAYGPATSRRGVRWTVGPISGVHSVPIEMPNAVSTTAEQPDREEGMIPRGTVSRMLLTCALLCSLVTTASAAATPEAKCGAGKIDLSGKYAACVAKAEKALVLKGDSGKYATQLVKCEEKLTAKWAKLEAGGACWSDGDGPKVQDLVEASAWAVAKGVTLGGEPSGYIACYAKSVECLELSQCCIVKIGCYDPFLAINVTLSYSNCNSSHTYEQL